MAFMYAGGPRKLRTFKVANAETIGARQSIYFSSNQYVGQAVNNCHACGVTVTSAELTTADGQYQVTADTHPDTEFWADTQGTALATDVPGKCDVYDHNNVDMDSATTGNVEILEVDTVNDRVRCRINFQTAYQQTGLS